MGEAHANTFGETVTAAVIVAILWSILGMVVTVVLAGAGTCTIFSGREDEEVAGMMGFIFIAATLMNFYLPQL